jgi:hypothetical protein
MSDFAVLDQLVDLITAGVADIKRSYKDAGIPAPRLNEPWAPTPIDHQVEAQALLVSAAATQLAATLRAPHHLLWESTWGVSYST